MKVLGIFPARKGSKRIPGKNTRLLNGKPLVAYALDAFVKCSNLHERVVSSDDDVVERIAGQHPNVHFIRRPEAIATDDAPAISYVHHVLSTLQHSFDVVVIVQPTTPFVNASDIDNTIELLRSNPGADSAVTVMQIQQLHHPYKLKVMRDGQLLPFLVDEKGIVAAQQLPDVFVRNGAVYASRMHVITRNEILGERCLGFVMPPERSVDINYPIDFDFAEFLAKKNDY